MEYIERSVQTETVNTTASNSRKSSHESRISKDLLSNIRKGSADSRLESETKPTIPPVSVNLGRSVSAGDKVKHAIPKVSKRWNQTFQDHSHSQFVIPPFKGGSGPTPSESLPLLSAPANFDNKANSFNFSAKPEIVSPSPDQKASPDPETATSKSKSSESMTASTIKEESIASDTIAETDSFLEDREDEDKFSNQLPGRKVFPSAESLPVATPTENTGESTEDKVETPKTVKKHPAKFLKRAQSFSQVFKKMADKRKKSGETLRDDYRCAIMEPLGELALVPLEKLVSIEDLQHSRISEEP